MLCLSVSPVYADVIYGQVNDKEVVTPSNYRESRKSQGASIEVITLEDIKEQNNPFISDLLRQQPGVSVQRSGSEGDVTSFRTIS